MTRPFAALTLTAFLGAAAFGCSSADEGSRDIVGKADDFSEKAMIYGVYCTATTFEGKKYSVDVTYALDPALLEQPGPYSITLEDASVLVETYVTQDGQKVDAESMTEVMDSIDIDVTDDGIDYYFSNTAASDPALFPTADYVSIDPQEGDIATSNDDELIFQVSATTGNTTSGVRGSFVHAYCETAGPFADL